MQFNEHIGVLIHFFTHWVVVQVCEEEGPRGETRFYKRPGARPRILVVPHGDGEEVQVREGRNQSVRG